MTISMDWNERLDQYKRYALKKGYAFCADDFASYAVLKNLEGRETNLKFMLVDFLRLNYGAKEISEILMNQVLDEKTIDKRLLDSENVTAMKMVDDALRELEPMDRCIYLLYTQWGLKLTEIGFLIGRGHGVVMRQIRMVREHLEERYGSYRSTDRSARDGAENLGQEINDEIL